MEDYSKMSNTELKLKMETVANEFEAKKLEIIEKCKELEEIQSRYSAINNELSLRKNLF
jgi:hypothetical protein